MWLFHLLSLKLDINGCMLKCRIDLLLNLVNVLVHLHIVRQCVFLTYKMSVFSGLPTAWSSGTEVVKCYGTADAYSYTSAA